MNPEKVVFGFFIVLAATLNFGFFVGGMTTFSGNGVYHFFAALVVNVIAGLLKLGDLSGLGAIQLATSLVAVVHLFAAALVWGYSSQVAGVDTLPSFIPTVIFLSGGALLANLVSVCLLVADTIMQQM